VSKEIEMSFHTFSRSPLALAAALMLSAAALPALAQTTKDGAAKATAAATTGAKASAEDRDLMKLSQDGFQAMRDVRAARIAIFNGNPQVAHDQLAAAKVSLQAATKEAPVFVVDVKTGMNGKIVDDTKSVDRVDTVPIDGQIVLADSFVDAPAKKAHIDKANEHIAGGRGKAAIDELKLAEVDASFTRVLMPLQATTKHVDEASKLVDEKKYYEANLALKAAEDGLRLDSITLSETPKPKMAAKAQK
jgi:hypothetical protein